MNILTSIHTDEEEEAPSDASIVMEDTKVDCPICLESMSPTDHTHALQCQHRCGYNFCQTCIDSLISSSKDDFMEASDGNYHVKIYLHCPNCRSDLSTSIRDTLLLRRADSMVRRRNIGESLTDSDRKMERFLRRSQSVRDAVEVARSKEEEFFGLGQAENPDETPSSNTDAEYEEWGVEADLIRGVHESFHIPRPPSPATATHSIDKTLFSGRDRSRSDQQLESLTEWLTSGDTIKLVQAARLLATEQRDASSFHLGMQAFQRRSLYRMSSRRSSRLSFRSTGSGSESLTSSSRNDSIHLLIEEAKQARERANRPPQPSPLAIARDLVEIEREAQLLQTHPLPVRMPKHIVLTRADLAALPVTFCNDTWDGTVLDAFCKISIGLFQTVTKHTTSANHPGVRRILNSDGPVRIDTPKRRVIVASVRGHCSSQGVIKGDVVTHVNGKPVDCDAEELSTQLGSTRGKVELTLNAEQSVAQALQLRSLAASSHQLD